MKFITNLFTNAGLKKEKHMFRTKVWTKLLIAVLLKAITAFAQSSDRFAGD
jgi:hypothetical protein